MHKVPTVTTCRRLRNLRPTRHRTAPLFAAALLPAVLFAGAPPATANAPGHPGTPANPTVLFTEDFENGASTTGTLLTDYTGAAPLNETYTADPAWLDTSACNGYIASPADPAAPPPPGCDDSGGWALVQASVADLGTWAGTDPGTNHALINFTDTDPGPGGTELQTTAPIPLPSAGRFLTVKTDAAGENCFGNDSLYQFDLLNGTSAQPISSAPFSPCADPGAVFGDALDAVHVGTYTGDLAVLASGTSVGIQLINEQGSGYGNDGALDNIRLLDVTPQLDLSGSTGTVLVGAPANLTFTVTNTSELDAKNGWSLTANLPAGLALANNTVTTTCASGTAAAGSATGTINVGGDLAAGQASCTVTVQVTSILGGSYQLCAGQMTNLVGLDPPGCTTLTFTAPVFDARSDSALLVSPLLDLGPLAPSKYECTSAPGSVGNTVVSAGLGTLGSLGALTTSASGTIAGNGTRTAAAGAQTAKVSLLAGLITADAVTTNARAQQALTTSGPGTVTVSGGTTFTNLRVAGVLIAADPGPNTVISVPLVASVILNQQTTIAGGDGITVNALDVTLLTGTQLTIGTSTAALLSATQTCPVS